jgi:hypothetical protein
LRTIIVLSLVAMTILALIVGPASAELNFGFKAGLSIANVFGGAIFDQSSRVGFCGGLFLTHDFSRVFSLQTEILFVMKGSRHREGFGPTNLYEVMNLEYMEIPLLARFRLPLSKSMDFHLLAGPALAFGIRSRVNTVVGGETEEESLDNVKGVDIGAVAGLGVDVPVKDGKICLDLRYTRGMTAISTGPGNKIKNGAACFTVGYAF